jgi:predicted ATPase/DNA-binding CsgD family transcriptional regulator
MSDALSSFIGRRREIEEAKSLLAGARLLTIVGPGGVGKTRLAMELADRARKGFADGVAVVELAALSTPSSIAPTMAAALNIPDQSNRAPLDRLIDHVRTRRMLIVIDNCEHLLEDAAKIASELLHAAPGLRIVATSREPLGLTGERMYLLSPMGIPAESDLDSPDGIGNFEAVRLLVERAQGIVEGFGVTAENQGAILQLCRRLDGVPLAIELAASRLRSLSVGEIVERLEDRFTLLTGGDRIALPRQQTLVALVDWSYELCTPAERQLWARLSVFADGFDLRAAESVCGYGHLEGQPIIDILDRLVAKSILRTVRNGEVVRFNQLWTLREYGRRLLDAGDDAECDLLKRRHRDHYLARAGSMVEQWCGPGQAARLAAVRLDHQNVMTALDWSATTPGEESAGASFASLLRFHWIAGGFLSDGRRWLERFLGLVDAPVAERGSLLWVAAWVALIQGDREAAGHYLEECHDLAVALDDPVLAGHVAHWTGLREIFCGNPVGAIGFLDNAVAAHQLSGDLAAELTAKFQIAMAQVYGPSPEAALATSREVLNISSEHGECWNRAYAYWTLALTLWHQGDFAEAKQAALSALELQRDFKDSICTALVIDLLAWIAASQGHPERAVELAAAAQNVWVGLGTTVEAFGAQISNDAQRFSRVVGAPSHLHPGVVNSMRPAMTKDAAIEMALRPGITLSGAARSKEPQDVAAGLVLTKREHQIAALVAEGKNSRAIAEVLFISPRTVDGHVERILAKLDFSSRSQIAAWIAARSPARL